MSEQYVEAFKRAGWLGVLGGLLVGVTVGLVEYQRSHDWVGGAIGGLMAMGTAIVGRGFVEGKIDTARAKAVSNGDADAVIASDVGSHIVKDALR